MRSGMLMTIGMIVVLAGCSAAPAAWTAGPTLGSSQGVSPDPSGPIDPSATASPEPTAPPSEAPPPLAELPDGIGGMAWAIAEPIANDVGDVNEWRLRFGPIGGAASTTITTAIEQGFVQATASGSMVAAAVTTEGLTREDSVTVVEAWRLPGTSLLRVALRTPWLQRLEADGDRGLVYAAAHKVGGGVDIVRIQAGREPVTLLGLDERFTPDGIPTERFDITLTPAGDLLVVACASDEPCRLWRFDPAAEKAEPVDLDPSIPIICSVVGATERVVVVYDDAACWADYDEAPVPLRAIDLDTGTSRLLHDGPNFRAARVIELDGRAEVVGRSWSSGGGNVVSFDIIALDVADGTRRTILADVPADVDIDGRWASQVLVSDTRLPADRLLILHGYREASVIPEPLAPFLLRASDGTVITLPTSTSGD